MSERTLTLPPFDSFEAAYPRLRLVAARFLAAERVGHTLQPTALVHEAYLRMGDAWPTVPRRGELFAMAARAMRNVLIDHARRKLAMKRGGREERTPLDEAVAVYESRALDLLALHEALEAMSRMDERMANIVELRFFAGLNEAETAEIVGVSPCTVRRDWRLARNWLARQLKDDDSREHRTVA